MCNVRRWLSVSTPQVVRRIITAAGVPGVKFRDLNLLLGSEAFLMREPTEGTTVALRLQDTEEPITQETALDLWFASYVGLLLDFWPSRPVHLQLHHSEIQN